MPCRSGGGGAGSSGNGGGGHGVDVSRDFLAVNQRPSSLSLSRSDSA